MKKKEYISIGLISGTSMDGLDLSIVKSDGNSEFVSILDEYFEFDKIIYDKLVNLREKLYTPQDLDNNLEELSEIEREITLFISKIIKEILSDFTENIDLIGFHGQTIFHNSNLKISKQLGDGNLLSQITKKIVISNFRENDLLNGGQGAPLTPIFHKLISEIINKKNNFKKPTYIVNIGGITNITQIKYKEDLHNPNLIACDIAPGNCLIDEWIRKKTRKRFDKNGDIARSGKVNEIIYNQAIDNFEIKDFKKSLDVKDFDLSFVKGLSLEDGAATLTKFSAFLIARGIDYFVKSRDDEKGIFLACGGGRKNNFLIENINYELVGKKIQLENIDAYKFKGDFIESQAFAYLAIRSYLKLPISFPGTTGCKSPTLGGKLSKNFN